jgi:uncharacterized protein (DUF1330 family)
VPAYSVIIARTLDPQALMEYARLTNPLTEAMGGRYVLRARGATLLEGDFGEGAGVLIVEWPDKDTALRFWNSAEYREIKKIREGKAEVQVVLVEGELAA